MSAARILLATLALGLAGCVTPGPAPIAQDPRATVPQTCPAVSKPVLARYINDPFAPYWCRLHFGLDVPGWGGCTTCVDAGTHLACEIRLPGKPNEVSPHALADEAQHLFGCVHAMGARHD